MRHYRVLMIDRPFQGSPGFRDVWRRSAILLVTWVAACEMLVQAAAMRVAAVSEIAAAPSPLRVAGHGLILAVTGVLGLTLLYLALAGMMRWITLIANRTQPPDPPSDADTAFRVASAAVLMGAVNLAGSGLTTPILINGRPVDVPFLSAAAGQYVRPLQAGLLAEIIIALWGRIRGRERDWWGLRSLLGLYWCAIALWAISGPNLLRGDPLEWAARAGSGTLPQAFLARAPLALAPWWPAFRAGFLVVLSFSLASTLREAGHAFRLWRTSKRPSGS
jgi:hypothetical protein